MNKHLSLLAALWLASSASAQPEAVDPLTAEIQLDDARRFVALFQRTDGQPTAEEIQREYLDPGSYGVDVFTPGRIVDAERLAARIAERPEDYRTAIETCLPMVEAANADLRSIYLGLSGALPEARLPQVYVLFGAGNSGGTAGPGAQVLGLEVLCRIAGEPDAMRRTLRHFFAHETVHVLQIDAGADEEHDPLLSSVLREGAADFIARLVTGEEPDPERAEWALPREAELFARLAEDIDIVRDGTGDAEAAMHRWVGNYGSAPDGWPGELGYWMGLRIWERYWAQAEDKQAALQRMLSVDDPREILAIAHGAQ